MKTRFVMYGEHRWHSPYVRLYWSPILGPSAMAMWDRICREGQAQGEVDVEQIALEIGISPAQGLRTLDRLRQFQVVTDEDEGIVVNLHRAQLAGYQVGRLPRRLRLAHDSIEEAS